MVAEYRATGSFTINVSQFSAINFIPKYASVVAENRVLSPVGLSQRITSPFELPTARNFTLCDSECASEKK